jgi:exosome complex component RRP4
VTNIIRVLASHFVPLTDTVLLEAYEWTIEHEENVTDLQKEDFGDALVASISSPQ